VLVTLVEARQDGLKLTAIRNGNIVSVKMWMSKSTNIIMVYKKKSAASWVKNVGDGKCNFPTEEITGVQNFNFHLNSRSKFRFSPEYLQNGGFPAQNFVFSKENFPTRGRFFGMRKFRAMWAIAFPLLPPPPRPTAKKIFLSDFKLRRNVTPHL